jgi:BirA family biotin operon repressor/biotin-[acetyl-CoA-carboxylase] ligase
MRQAEIEVLRLSETTSTNDEAKRLMLQSMAQKVIVMTDYQTAGRGQTGNTWESERGKNLLFSVGVRPAFLPARRQFLLLQVMSLAVAQTLVQYTDNISIKWPNDIYWCDKKISGTLIENELSGESIRQCVLGTGINVNQEHFVSDAPNPVSLRQILGHDVPRDRLFMDFLKHFETFYSRLESGESESLAQQYGDSLYWREGMHPYRDSRGTFRAFIDGVEPDGHLLLRTDEGQVRRYAFKEVSFLITL